MAFSVSSRRGTQRLPSTPDRAMMVSLTLKGQQPGSPRDAPLRPECGGTGERLARVQSTLTELLCVIDDDARHMDANLGDAHELVRSMRMLVGQGHRGRTAGGSREQRACHAFELARVAENDAYGIYAYDLERFRKRRRQDLGVAELDSDMCALVKRRRAYISTLLACQTHVSAILRPRSYIPLHPPGMSARSGMTPPTGWVRPAASRFWSASSACARILWRLSP